MNNRLGCPGIIDLGHPKGQALSLNDPVVFSIGDDMDALAADVERLHLPSPVTKLEGAYVTVIPGEKEGVYILVMPVVPETEVAGQIKCMGQMVDIESTRSLAVYKVDSNGSEQVF